VPIAGISRASETLQTKENPPHKFGMLVTLVYFKTKGRTNTALGKYEQEKNERSDKLFFIKWCKHRTNGEERTNRKLP